MSHSAKLAVNGWQKWAGLLLPAIAGLLFFWTPLGKPLDGLSYDLLFVKPAFSPNEVCIVYMDERSLSELGQKPSDWDRTLHARFLDRMTADEAKLVVFDVWFKDPGTGEANEAFRQAIQKNGRVVFAATSVREEAAGLVLARADKPVIFCDVAAGWGIAELDKGTVNRRFPPNHEWGPSLPAAALTATGAKSPAVDLLKCWLNYYGPPGTIPNVSYCDVTNKPAGFFHNKTVFVGGRPRVGYVLEEADEFRTPYSRGIANFPGVEILATAYLNLARNEMLVRLHPAFEFALVIAFGLLLGWLGCRLKPLPASGVAIAVAAVVLFLCFIIYAAQRTWFSGLLVAGVQVPVALAWQLGVWIVSSRPPPELSPFFTFDGKRRIPNIPDHTLIKRIGRGSYGEVWLAKNLIGMFRAVKFAFRDRYPEAEPYDREFSGIEKYMPISIHHPWLVHVLHVGKNEANGYFFYIMEVGDDVASGREFDPLKYVPRNLLSELDRRGRLSVPECVTLGLHLTTALECLHRSDLIHRDIKPANIIYAGNIPKFADIGLVTEARSRATHSSYVGTDGYIPPEGPGTAVGDLYSLGKVLYEISTGMDRKEYPDLPASFMDGPLERGFRQFNDIVLKACESDPSVRYQSAAEIHADLLQLEHWLKNPEADSTAVIAEISSPTR